MKMENQYKTIYDGQVDVARDVEALKYQLTETVTLREIDLGSTTLKSIVDEIRNEFLNSALRAQKIIGKPISLDYALYENLEEK